MVGFTFTRPHADWDQINGPDPAVATCMVEHDGVLIVGSHEADAGDVFRSTDGGVTWHPVGGNFPASADVEALAASGSAIFVAGGQFGNAAIYASLDDGQTWGPIENGATVLAGTGGAGLRVIGNTALDGVSWSRVGLPNGFVETLHATRGVLIAAEFDQVISVSTDGTTWAPFTPTCPKPPPTTCASSRIPSTHARKSASNCPLMARSR